MRTIKMLNGFSMNLYIGLIILMLSSYTQASMPPVSGTFSISKDVIEKHKLLYQHTKSNKSHTINLIVTANKGGQQFFVQCFKNNQAGLGVITNFDTKKLIAEINAGPECPSSKLEVQLDYEDATLRFGNEWILLMRSGISVPYVFE
jgi:hypothetical protein